MNLYVLLAVVSVFLNFIHAAPGVDISNDELLDGKYLCEAGSKKYDGPFIVRLISAANGQTVVCYECSQSEFKTKYSVKQCAAGKIGSGHHRDLVPYLVRMDPLYKDTWSSKLKRNFDEIDKASASFSILNQLV
uniref:GEO08248p1 n=1 Tax=Drosophila melanogaster TaxID=7227 RepID=Q9W1F8_DROME|eukprot:NP_611852.2 orcokinin, isoform A [Drosophila melanogaster]